MDRKTIWVGILSFLVIGLVALGVYLFGSKGLRGASYAEPYPPAPEFELTQADGTHLRLSEMRGNLVLVFFGYTACPDVCPTTMAEIKQATTLLGEERAQHVRVIFITVDPKRDTPQRVQEYADHFSKDFIGLGGTEAELQKTWNDYGIFRTIVEGTSAAGYGVDHTARVTLIDQEGNLRTSYGFDTPVGDIVHDLKVLLR